MSKPLTYELGVYIRLITDVLELHIFTLEIDQPLTWVKSHADELASRCLTGAVKKYCALHVAAV